MTINLIQADWIAGAATRQSLDRVLDGMVRVEQAALGFLDPENGLQRNYGTKPPAVPMGPWPNVFHYPSTQPSPIRSLTTMGGNLMSHPGGIRVTTDLILIAFILGNRAENLDVLIAKTLFWREAYDMCYSANHNIDGTTHDAMLVHSVWGSIPWIGSKQDYFGWIFGVQIGTQNSMRAG